MTIKPEHRVMASDSRNGNLGCVLWMVMIVMQSGSAVRVLCSEKIYTVHPFYSIPIPQNCRVEALRAASNYSNKVLEVSHNRGQTSYHACT